jgi:hypothetical protein
MKLFHVWFFPSYQYLRKKIALRGVCFSYMAAAVNASGNASPRSTR